MSEFADVGTDTGTVEAAPDIPVGDSSTPEAVPEAAPERKPFTIDPQRFQQEPDVSTVTDPPVIRQDAEVTTPAEEPAETPTDAAFTPNDQLNWDSVSAPQFRDEYQSLKQAYLDLSAGSLETQFLTAPQEFTKWMQDTSPTSFKEIATSVASEAANANPQGWIDYFVQTNPDAVAQALTGKTADELKAHLAVFDDEYEDPDVKAKLEEIQANKVVEPKETDEQKADRAALKEFKEERHREKLAAITTRVFQPTENEINSLVSQAGLEIEQSDYQGKDFLSLDPETQFKAMVSEMMPVFIGECVNSNPQTAHLQARLQEFLDKGDEASAMKMQHQIRIVATNYAGKFLELVTGKRAEAKKAETQSPTNDSPAPVVRSNGSLNGGIPPAGDRPLFGVSEASLQRAVARG